MSQGMFHPSEEQMAFSERAHDVIPGGAHTYSKGDDLLPVNAPRGFVKGKGGRVVDLDGNEFVDWSMGIQNVLIGHAEDSIDDAVVGAIRNGQNFSRPTPLEVETAECLLALYPWADMVKFAKNGSDANTAAIRLARSVTGRNYVAYDGTAPFLAIHDWFIGTTPVNSGIPAEISDLSISFSYNDLDSVERVFANHPERIAALIMEVARESKPDRDFLKGVRNLCTENGAVLIFDEVVTGFRYHLSGAHALFGVQPDLMSVGKGLGNGYSVTALVGRRHLMERGGIRHSQERVFLMSTTNGAEQSALAAGLATIGFYRSNPVIERIWETGRALMDGINRITADFGIQGFLFAQSDFACRPVVHTLDSTRQPSAEYRTLFLQELIKKKVFMPWICPAFRHASKDLEQTFYAVNFACESYRTALEKKSVDGLLVGRPVKAVFRKWN